jgi:hypothetical protein
MQTRFYNWLLAKIIPFIRFTTYYTELRGKHYHNIYGLIRPGDIILCTDSKKLTSVLIPGIVDHAALFVGYHNDFEVCEMNHNGFTKSYVCDVWKESTRVLIIRVMTWSENYILNIIEKCLSFEGCEYDNAFELGIKKLYCSELIYQSDYMNLMRVDLTDLAGLGRKYISPMGLLLSYDSYCVYDSDGKFDGLTGDQIEWLLKQK